MDSVIGVSTRWHRNVGRAGCLAALLVLTCMMMPGGAQGAPSASWHVVKKIPVGGEGSWDYLALDRAGKRLFIARSTRVQVVDVESGKLVGEIGDTEGVHGVVLVPEVGRGFTSNGTSSTVSIFDLATLKVVKRVAVGQKPDAIIYEPKSRRVLTMNGKSDDCSVLDASRGEVVGTVALGGQPEFAASDGQGHVFVNLEDKSEVVEMDARTCKVLGRWSLAPGESPSGMAIDPRRHTLFIGCHNRAMVVFDTQKHVVVGKVPIGDGVDANAYDPTLDLAFSSNGEGTLTVVTAHPPALLQTVATLPGARTMALDPVKHRIYLCTATVVKKPTPEERKQGMRPQYTPGSFTILVVGR